MFSIFKKQEKFTWWMPKNMFRMTLYGTPQTKLQWILGSWEAYFAYWRLNIAFLQCLKKEIKKASNQNDNR